MRPTQTNAAAPSPATILVVEDDEDVRELLRRMLVRAGFAVQTAIDGADGLRLFRARRFDLVIIDVVMPEMGGFELMRALLGDDPSIKIVAVSGVEPTMDFLRM